MRLIATLLVRDEADVVAATVEHHLAQGVDLVIATDNGSVDGTREILQVYADAGVVEVIDEPDHTYRQAEWVTRMARRAAELGAEWVVNMDADEFWVPVERSRTLRDVLGQVPAEYATVLARRSDLVGVRGTWGPWPRRLRWRNLATVSEKGTPLAPKICHRATGEVGVAQGNHAVTGVQGAQLPTEPIDVLHVPLRSWPQFRRKIDNGGSSYAANSELTPDVGWHWRADYERLLAGELERVFHSREPSPSDLVSGVRAGTLVRDSWLLRRLQRLHRTAVRPDLLWAVLVGEPGVDQPGVDQPGVDQPGVDQPVVDEKGAGEPADALSPDSES